jgi:hypothetical protein
VKICPKCSTEFEDKFNFCRLDGTSLQVKALVKPCPACGKETEEGKGFCRHCGARLESEPEKSDQLVDHASVDSHVPKADRPVEHLSTAQFPSNDASGKISREIEQVSKSCPQCGKDVEAGKKFCRHCGARIESSTEAAPRTVGTPHVQEVVSHQQILPEPPKPAAEEKVAEKIERQVIQRQEIAQQTVTKHESPIEAAERDLKDGNYKDAIAALEPVVKNNAENQEARLLHLLASVKLYNIYGYEKEIESLTSISNFSEKERGLAREIFLTRFEEARKRGQEEEARRHQRLASRVILGQPLTEPAPETKAEETSTQWGVVKPFPEKKVGKIPQTPPKIIPSLQQKVAAPATEVATRPTRRSRGVLITVGIILGVGGVLGGGVLAFYAKSHGLSISNLYGKIFSGKELPGQDKKLSGKTDVAQVLAAEELGFKVWGTGAVDVNRLESLLSEKIESQLDGLRRIYQQQVQVNPSLMGSITLQLTVSPTGQVTKVEEFASQIKDAEFKKSVVEEAYKWRFPETTSGLVKVNYPLLFLPAGMDVTTLVRWEQSISPRVYNPTETARDRIANEDTASAEPVAKRPSLPPQVATTSASPTPAPPPIPPIEERRPTPSAITRPQPQSESAITGPYETLYPTSVYREPRADSQRVSSIPAGIKVNVVAVRGEWLEVQSKHGNPPGFIKKESAVPMASR